MGNVWCLQYPTTAPTLAVTRTEKINVDGRYISGFKLFVNVPIFNLPSDYASLITLTPTMQISSVLYSEAEQAIIISLATNILKTVEVNISISATRNGYYFKHPNQKHPLEALTAVSASEAIIFNGYDSNNIIANIDSVSVSIANVSFKNTIENETVSAEIVSFSFVLVPVSSLPI
jgi:hypothetical protein